MNADKLGAAVLFAVVAGCIVWAIRERRRRTEALAAFETHLDALRHDGLGVLVEPTDTPIFDSVAALVAAREARYLQTEWWLINPNKGQR